MPERVVLITGCSSGFGREMVPAFLARSWRVVATLRRAEARSALFTDDLRCYGERLRIVDLDVTDAAQRTVVMRGLDRLDCLVHNAGYSMSGPIEECAEADVRRQIETNFLAPVCLTRDLLPLLRACRGRVIFLSSMLGYSGFPLHSVYCASKFALEGFAESLSYELAPHGVQIALVEPGGHRTRFGDNAVSSDVLPGSAYAPQVDALRRLRARLGARPGRPARPVVAAIVALAEARRMRLRTRVGRDAVGIAGLRKLLPACLSDRLLRAGFARLLATGDA